MFNNEWLDKNVFTVKKITFKESNKPILGLILPHYLKNEVATNAIKVVNLNGKVALVPLNTCKDIQVTKVMDKAMRETLDEVIKVAREWNKCNMYLRRGTRGYTLERLNNSELELKRAISKLPSVYNVAYKDEVEKENKQREKEMIKRKELALKQKKAKEAELKKQQLLKEKQERENAKQLKIKQKQEEEMKKQIMKNYVKTPKFKNGGFMILRAFEENAVEYDSEEEYKVTIHLKTDAALKKLQKICRYATPDRTYNYGNSYGAKYEITCKLKGFDFSDVYSLFGDYYLKNELDVFYQNHYSDEEWETTIHIPSFTYDKRDERWGVDEYSYFGSCGNRGKSFFEYLEKLKKEAKWID